jgi:hypothetical protein
MSYRNIGRFKSLTLIVQTMRKPKPGFKIGLLYLSQIYYFFQKKKKKKKKAIQIEEIMNENGRRHD